MMPAAHMMKTLFLLPIFLAAACLDTPDDELGSVDQASTGEQGLHGAPEHLHYARGERQAHGHGGGGGGGSSPLLAYHNGPVLVTNKTQAIFWGSSWSSNPGDKITGMDSFFAGFGGSNYAGLSTEYSGITRTSTYLGHTIDGTSPPHKALSTSQAVAEACKITNNNPDPNGVYFIFTDTGAGHANYCAWHSWGNCSNGAQIQVAYMPNIDGIAGCDAGGAQNGHSQGLTALANVTAHELSEAITDPRGSGWYDSAGAENGDKCAWTFGGTVTLSNGSQWLLQQEWSNAAYNGSQGSPRGCLQGN